MPLVQHSLSPISRISAKGAREGASRNLHPDAGPGEPSDGVILGTDPRQPLGMGQDRNVLGRQYCKKELFQSRRWHVVGGLDEDVAGVGERDQVAAPEAGDEVGHNVVVRAHHELEADALLVENPLQMLHYLADLRAAIMVNAGQDVGRAGDVGHAVGDESPRHGERHRHVASTVVDTRENMAMEVNHGLRG